METRTVETCGGRIDMIGNCSRCGQKNQTSSYHCTRLIEVIPASANTTINSERVDLISKSLLIAELDKEKNNKMNCVYDPDYEIGIERAIEIIKQLKP